MIFYRKRINTEKKKMTREKLFFSKVFSHSICEEVKPSRGERR